MTMTISIFTKKHYLNVLFLVFLICNSLYSEKPPATATRVPADSFFVLSANFDAIFNKSKIKESRVWEPLLNSLNLSNPEFHNLLSDFENNGFNPNVPVQIFARTKNTEKNSLSLGLIAQIADTKKSDLTLNRIAESTGFNPIAANKPRFQKKGIPIEFGRKGRFFYVLGLGPKTTSEQAITLSLEKFYQDIPMQPIDGRFPNSLKIFFSTRSDLGVYLDGSGFANLLENNWPDDRWKNFLPLLDPIFSRQFGLHMTSQTGSIKITANDYTHGIESSSVSAKGLSSIELLPGDSPLVARLSVPKEDFLDSLNTGVDKFLRVFTNNQINKDSKLPGSDSTASELISSINGDFIFAGGNFSEKSFYQNNGQLSTSLRPIFLLGIGIENRFALQQLLASLRTSNTIRALINSFNLKFTVKDDHLWFSSIELFRELNSDKTLGKLPKSRVKLLNNNNLAVDLDVNQANYSIRKNSKLTFSQLKLLNIADDFKKISIFNNDGILDVNLKLNDIKKHGWNVIFDHLGQSMIDKINSEIFLAISQNNLNSVIQSVQAGALINANDRFGHSPLHYAAYKGNPRIVDYLLNNGGNPNIRGRHDSTPLHSAAWGRNVQAIELLLEDGADVDARTDEGETPGMTAALRGEKDILEILFALSADPHATDIHGTNLIDLAAAGGHKAIVDLLQEIGVSNKNPLHVAAGLGDLNKIKRLLENGHSVNKRDAFGATPLLVAMVSGKEDVVDFLLSKNANPLLSAKDGYTLMHGAAFSGKKNLIRKALSYNLDVNSRYGPDGITPVDVAEESGDALPLLRALGGKTAWELGRIFPQN